MGAEFLQGLGASPGRVLVGPGEHGHRLGEFAVCRQRTVGVSVGAQDVRQYHRVGVVALGPRGRPALAVAGYAIGLMA